MKETNCGDEALGKPSSVNEKVLPQEVYQDVIQELTRKAVLENKPEEQKSMQPEQLVLARQGSKGNNFAAAIIVLLIVGTFATISMFPWKGITGLAVKDNFQNYTEQLFFSANKTSSLDWQPTVDGELRSFLVTGSAMGNGSFRIYLEDISERQRYLVLDESILRKQRIFSSVTGFVVSEPENQTDEPGQGENQTFEIPENESSELSNQTFNQTVPSENLTNQSENLNQTQGQNQTEDIAEEPVSVKKIINATLYYLDGTSFDVDNDGIENISGSVDVGLSANFSWEANQSNLCTRWKITSLDNQERSTICYGSATCCSVIELQPVFEEWNRPYYSFYGRHSEGLNNTVEAQVLYFDIGTDLSSIYLDSFYSEWDSILVAYLNETPAQQIVENITEEKNSAKIFESACVETCSLGRAKGPYRIVIETEGTIVSLEKIQSVMRQKLRPDVIILGKKNYTIRKSMRESWENDKFDVEIELEDAPLTNITLYNADISDIGRIRIEEIEDNFSVAGVEIGKKYLVDPSNISLDNLTIRAIATSDELYKCINYDNETGNCTSGWIKILDLVEGAEYELNISGADPVFVEGRKEKPKPRPGVAKLIKSRKDFREDEEPSFIIEKFSDEELNGSKIRRKDFRKHRKEFSDGNITIKPFLKNQYKRDSSSEVLVEELREGQYKISIGKGRQFRPGKYSIMIEIEENGTTIYQQQDFTWGVLAINPHKSIYLPSETSFLGMAVLNEFGRMECFADVRLHITAPDGTSTYLSTSDESISKSEECEKYGVTNLPDYYANYTTTIEGNYTLNLTATTSSGEFSIQDKLVVQQNTDFDVVRNAPTRIYPKVRYKVNLGILANKDYEGIIRETVPEGFEIDYQQGMNVLVENDEKILEWQANISEGDFIGLEYTFDAPDISPSMFRLGPLEIGNFSETRQWTIASDSIGSRQQKTVQYFIFQQPGIFTTGTTGFRNVSERTIYIPEVDPKVVSAWVDLQYQSTTALTTGGSNRSAIMVNGTTAQFLGHGGTWPTESLTTRYFANVTNVLKELGLRQGDNRLNFTTNITAGTISTPNAKLYLTYEYDDASPEQLQTVRFFINQSEEKHLTVVTGGVLSGINASYNFTLKGIPRTAIVRDMFIEFNGITEATATSDQGYNITLDRVDSVPRTVVNTFDSISGSYAWRMFYWNATNSFNPFVNHTITFRNSTQVTAGAAGTYPVSGLNAEIYLTYSFDADGESTRLETMSYFVMQNDSSFAMTTPQNLPQKGVKISLPQAKVSVIDAYLVVRGLYSKGTSAGKYRANLTIAGYVTGQTYSGSKNFTVTTTGDATVPTTPFMIMFRNFTDLSAFTDNSNVQCLLNMSQTPGSALGLGFGSPSCELIITYNYSYPESTTLAKTVGFFAGASTGTAAAVALSTRYNTSFPSNANDEAIATVKNSYIFGVTPSSATALSFFFINATNHSQGFDQTTYNYTNRYVVSDTRPNLLFALFNTTKNITQLDSMYNLTMRTRSAAAMSAVQFATYTHAKPGDTIKPLVTLNEPANNTNVSADDLILNFTGEDINGLSTAQLLITVPGDDRNSTNLTEIFSGVKASLNVSHLAEGSYNWTALACDRAVVPNCNVSTSNYSFTLDRFFPNQSLIVPMGNTNYTGTILFNFSLNDSMSGIREAYVQLANWSDNVTGWIAMNLSTGDKNVGYWNVTYDFFAILDGIYNVSINVTDFVSHNRTVYNLTYITIDRGVQNATFHTPVNGTNFSAYANINLSINDSVSGIMEAYFQIANWSNNVTGWIALNRSSGTIQSGYWNYTGFNVRLIPSGKYNLSVNATDYLRNNLTRYNITFIVIDHTIENATFIVPMHMLNISNLLSVNISGNDSLSGIEEGYFQVSNTSNNATGWIALNLSSGTINAGYWNHTNYAVNSIRQGIYNLSLNLTDYSRNNLTLYNLSSIQIDYSVDNASFISPINNTNASTEFSVNLSINDSITGIMEAYFQLANRSNNVTGWIALNRSSGSIRAGYWNFTSYNVLWLPDGFYNLSVNATDYARNNLTRYNFSVITIDHSSENATTVSPINYSNISTFLFVNFSMNDTFSGVQEAYFRISNSTTNVTGWIALNFSSGTIRAGYWNYTGYGISTFREGYYNISVNYSDYSRNNLTLYNITQVLIDNNVPNITSIAPQNYSNSSISWQMFNFSINDSASGIQFAYLQVWNITENITGWLRVNASSGTIFQDYYNLTFDFSSFADGGYNVSVNATDYAGNQRLARNFTRLFIDRTVGNASAILPINLTNVSTYLDVNFSVNDTGTGIQEAYFQIWNSSHNVSGWITLNLSSGTKSQGYWNYSRLLLTSIADGDYNISVNTTDFSRNNNSVFNLTSISIDNTAPNATITEPLNYSLLTGMVNLNSSVNDSFLGVMNVSFVFVNHDGDASLPFYAEIWSGDKNIGHWNYTLNTSLLGNGWFNITINATDYAGSQRIIANHTTVRFSNIFTDTIAPNISTVVPLNGSGDSSFIDINASINDTTGVASAYAWIWQGTDSITQGITLNLTGDNKEGYWNYSSYDISLLPEGTYNLSINATDTDDNANVRYTANSTYFYVDRTVPNASMDFPINITNISNYLNINVSSNDSLSGVSELYFQLSNGSNNVTAWITANFSSGLVFAGYWNHTGFSVSSIPDGFYNLSVNATDYSNNNLTRENITVILIDHSVDNATFVVPQTYRNYSTLLSVNLSINDSFSGVEAAHFQLANTTNNATGWIALNHSSGSIFAGYWNYSEYGLSQIAQGRYNLSVNYSDYSKNNLTRRNISTIMIDYSVDIAVFGIPIRGANTTNMLSVNLSINDSFSGVQEAYFQIANTTNNATGWIALNLSSGTINNGSWNYTGYDMSLLPEGPYNLSVNYTDFSRNNLTLYNITSIMFDRTTGNITILLPSNQSNFTNAFSINASINDSLSGVLEAHFHLANSSHNVTGWVALNHSSGPIFAGYWNNTEYLLPSVPDGPYYVNVNYSDFAKNSFQIYNSSVIIIDRAVQNATFIVPENTSNVSSILNINASINDTSSGVQEAYFQLANTSNNATGWVALNLSSGTASIGFWNFTGFDVSSIPDGTYNLSLNYTDHSRNSLARYNFTFIVIDHSVQNVSIQIPVNLSNLTELMSLNVSANDTLSGISEAYFQIGNITNNVTGWIALNLSSGTINQGKWNNTNYSISNIPEGFYNLSINATDFSRNSLARYNITAIRIDHSDPNGTFITPLNNSNISGSYMFNISGNDSVSGIAQAYLLISNSSENITMWLHLNRSSGSLLVGYLNNSVLTTPMLDGPVNLSLNLTDFAGHNIELHNITSISIDNQVPYLAAISPLNKTNTSRFALVNVSINDTGSGVMFAYAMLFNKSGNTTGWRALNRSFGTQREGEWNITFDMLLFDEGDFNVSINATDFTGKMVSVHNLSTFVYDRTVPNVTIVLPSNGTSVSNTMIINASANDSKANISSVSFQLMNLSEPAIDPLSATYSLESGGYWILEFDTTTLPNGTYNITVNATDFAGNSKVIENHTNFKIHNLQTVADSIGPLQQKTIQYFVLQDYGIFATTPPAGYTNSTLVNVYIPEYDPRPVSAWLDLQFSGSTVVLRGPSAVLVNGTVAQFIGAGGAHSGEVMTSRYLVNLTNRFKTMGLKTGNNTYNITVNISAGSVSSPSAKLLLTYEYNGQSPEQLQTVRVFLNQTTHEELIARTAGLNTTLTMRPLSGIPDSAVVRDAWIEMSGLIEGTAATDQGYNITIDRDSFKPTSPTLMFDSIGGTFFFRIFHKNTTIRGFNLSGQHPVKFQNSTQTAAGVANTYSISTFGAEAYVTYSFDATVDQGRLETMSYFIGQNDSSFQQTTGVQHTPVMMNRVSLPSKKITIQDAYMIIRGSFGRGTSAALATDANITARTWVGSGEDSIGRNFTIAQSSDASVAAFPFVILYKNESAFRTLADNSLVKCNISAFASPTSTAAGVSSPSCELIVTYNYSYIDSASYAKTVGFFATSSEGAAATTAILAKYNVSQPPDEATQVAKNSYVFATALYAAPPGQRFGAFIINATNASDPTGFKALNFTAVDAEQLNMVFGLFNTTSNLSQLNLLYNLTMRAPQIASPMSAMQYVTYTYSKPLDTVPPVVRLLSPLNATNVTDNEIFFNFTAYDVGGLKNATLMINYTGIYLENETNVSAVYSGRNSSVSSDTSIEGFFHWSVRVCDRIVNSNCNTSTANFTITLDKFTPNASFMWPINGSNYSTIIRINLSVNDSGTGVREAYVQLWNITDNVTIWDSINRTSGDKFRGYANMTFYVGDIPSGLYNISVNVTDFTGRNFTIYNYTWIAIDHQVQNATFVSPVNKSNLTTTLNVNLSINDTVTGIMEAYFQLANWSNNVTGWIALNFSSGTINYGYWNFTGYDISSLPEGYYNLSLNVTDFSRNNLTRYNITTITIDRSANNATFTIPVNITNVTSMLYVNASINDTLSGVAEGYVRVYNTGGGLSGWLTMNLSRGTIFAGNWNYTGIDLSAASEGLYNLSVNYSDFAGNKMARHNITLILVDHNIQNATFLLPVNNSNFSNFMSVNLSINDTLSGIEEAYFQLANRTSNATGWIALNRSSGSINYGYWNFTDYSLSWLRDGNYNLSINATDYARSNLSVLNTTSFTIDHSVGNATFKQPLRETNSSRLLNVNLSINDSITGVEFAYFQLSNTTNNATGWIALNRSVGTIFVGYWNFTDYVASGLPQGRYNLSVNYSDYSKNNLTALNLTFFMLDYSVDNATFVLPQNFSNISSFFSINLSLNDSFSGVEFAYFQIGNTTNNITGWIALNFSSGSINNGYWNFTSYDVQRIQSGRYNLSVNYSDYSKNNLTRYNITVITIDHHVENATFFFPINETNVSNVLHVNATINDSISGIQEAYFRLENTTNNATEWLTLNHSSGTIFAGYWNHTLYTSTIPQGRYNLSINTTDYLRNNFTRLNFTTITIDYSVNNATFLSANVTNFSNTISLNLSINDSFSGISQAHIQIVNWSDNLTDWIALNRSSGTIRAGYWNITRFPVSSITQGLYNLSVNASDFSGNNLTVRNTSTIMIDYSVDNATILLPFANQNYSQSIMINASLNDSFSGVEFAYFQLANWSNNATGWIALNFSSGSINDGYWNNTYPITGLRDGRYNISLNHSDYSKNNLTSLNLTYITIDNTAPQNISIVSFANNSNISLSSVLLNFSINDSTSGVLFAHVMVWNNTVNVTGWIALNMSSGSINHGYWNTTIDFANLDDSSYNVTINATDFAGNIRQSINKTRIVIDRSSPNATFSSPLDGTNHSRFLSVNLSINDSLAGIQEAYFQIANWSNNATGWIALNRSVGTIFFGYWNNTLLEVSSLPDGNYNLSVNATDYSRNNITRFNITAIIIDHSYPNSSIVSPINFTNASIININLSINDSVTGIHEAYFQLANTTNNVTGWVAMNLSSGTINIGYWNYTEFTLSLFPDGRYNISVNATDFAKNNLTRYNFSTVQIDRLANNATIRTPSNGSNISSKLTINISANDSVTGFEEGHFQISNWSDNATGWIALNRSGGTIHMGYWNFTNYDVSWLPQGRYNLSVNMSDFSSNNLTVYNLTNVMIDYTVGNFSIIGPSLEENVSNYLSINLSVNDSFSGIFEAYFQLANWSNNATGWIALNLSSGTINAGYWNYTSYQVTSLRQGFYNISLNITDFSRNNNTIYNVSQIFVIDYSAPNASFVSPIQNLNISRLLDVNLSVNDSFSGVSEAYFQLANWSNNATGWIALNLSSGSINAGYWNFTSYATSWLPQGKYNLSLNATDFSRNNLTRYNISSIMLDYSVDNATILSVNVSNVSNFLDINVSVNDSFSGVSEAYFQLANWSNNATGWIALNLSSGTINNGNWNFTRMPVSGLAQGRYNLSLNASDFSRNNLTVMNLSVVMIDYTVGNATIESPARNQNASTSIDLNASINDSFSGVEHAQFRISNLSNNVTGWIDINFSSGTINDGYWNNTGYSIASLPDGRYNISINYSDYSKNNLSIYNQTYFTKDTSGPENLSVISPRNISNISISTTLLNSSINDSVTGVYSVYAQLWNETDNVTSWLTLNQSSGTINAGYWNITLFLGSTPEGRYNISINATDFSQNSRMFRNHTQIIIDRSSANATILTPVNGSNFSTSLLINASVNDTLSGIIQAQVMLWNSSENVSGWLSMTRGSGTSNHGYWNITINTSRFDDNHYNISLNITDFAANSMVVHNSTTITIIGDPKMMNVSFTGQNVTLRWLNQTLADNYSIYISDNYLVFQSRPNVTGITDNNWTDINTSKSRSLFYKIEPIRGSASRISSITGGKYEISLNKSWNLISMPFNLSQYRLENGTNPGFDFAGINKCQRSLWRFNATRGFERSDYNGTAWLPSTGSENFTELHRGMAYWLETNETCNLTVYGTVPNTNLSVNYLTDFNLAGWHSLKNGTLEMNYQAPLMYITPANNFRAIDRYNPTSGQFEVTMFYMDGSSPWGWWPSWNNQDFTNIEPTKGYYFDFVNPTTWLHNP